MPHIPVSYTIGGGNLAQYTLAASLRDNIVVAHHRYLTSVLYVNSGYINY